MNMRLAAGCVALVLGLAPKGPGEVTRLTGPQLKACVVALDRFAKETPDAHLANYTVEVSTEREGFEVAFVPLHPLGRTARGGETALGKEVHYVVSKQGFEIVRTFWGR
jgi:hypothetical protein